MRRFELTFNGVDKFGIYDLINHKQLCENVDYIYGDFYDTQPFLLKKSNLYGAINSNGELIVSFDYGDVISRYRDYCCCLLRDSYYHIIDDNGKLLEKIKENNNYTEILKSYRIKYVRNNKLKMLNVI